MGKPKKKNVINAATSSDLPTLVKKARKLKSGKKKKVSSIVKIAGPEKINIGANDEVKTEATTEINTEVDNTINAEESEKVKVVPIQADGSTQVNEQIQNISKDTKAIKESIGGLIFMCNSRTKPDCFRYKVLGLPENKRDFVSAIKPGMKLFLYDFEVKLLYGIFKASSVGGMKLEPAAFNGFYPAQVRFEVESARAPIHYHIFKNAIKDNFTGVRNMFNVELSTEQVKELDKLFPPAPPGHQLFAPVMHPAAATAPALDPAIAPALAPAIAPALPPAAAPFRTSRPIIHPMHQHQFGNISRNHTALIHPEIAHAPFMHNPQKPTHFAPYMLPYPKPVPALPHPAPYMLPYDASRTTAFLDGPPSRDPLPGALRFTRVTEEPGLFNIRNEQQLINSGYPAQSSVSSRYAFAGPTSLYNRGLL